MRKRCAHRRCNTPVSWLLHRSRALQQRDPSYTNATTNITNFPYAGCDNDLGHSPLRLIYLSSTYQPNGQNTFCWTVSLATNTQCTTNNPDGTCCRQDLGSVEIEIREYNNSPHASLHAKHTPSLHSVQRRTQWKAWVPGLANHPSARWRLQLRGKPCELLPGRGTAA